MENHSLLLQALHQGSPGGSPTRKGNDYTVQSTYIPPEPSYDDPFAPASSNPFAGDSGVVAAAEVPSTTAVHADGAPSSTVLQFHGAFLALSALGACALYMWHDSFSWQHDEYGVLLQIPTSRHTMCMARWEEGLPGRFPPLQRFLQVRQSEFPFWQACP